MFSEKERAYLRGQKLARIATVGAELQPDVAPVMFQFDDPHLWIGGFELARSLKYKNVAAGRTRVAIVVDDLASVDPWEPRGVKIHGEAALVERGGRMQIRVAPSTHWSWGVEAPAIANGTKAPQRRVRW